MIGRCLGVDYGTARIGLAISDETGMLATPLATVAVRGIPDAVRAVTEHIRRTGAVRIVIGMPLHMNSSRGAGAEAADDFARRIRETTALPVIAWDERLTTRMAERALIEANVRRNRRRSVIDRAAAQLILQSYLDARAAGGTEEPLPE